MLCLLVWIAFLPNAPYIITDFMHLRHRPPVPLWFDVAFLASAAATGILLGYTSVADVQGLIRARFGGVISWGVALGALFLSGGYVAFVFMAMELGAQSERHPS